MKIGIFADPHHCGEELLCRNRRPRLSRGKIERFLAECRHTGVEHVVCLGDLINKEGQGEQNEKNLREIAGVLQAGGLPVTVCMGNHDAEVFDRETFARMTGFSVAPTLWETETHRLLFLDANYNADGTPYRQFDIDWKCCMLPQAELLWLAEALRRSTKPCVVFLHQNLDPAVQKDHILRNAGAVRAVLEQSGKVEAVYQGHFHEGHENTVNGIRYITLPAMCVEENCPFVVLSL